MKSQVPSDRQVNELVPLIVYPISHVYTAVVVWPSVSKEISPPDVVSNESQTTKRKKEFSNHYVNDKPYFVLLRHLHFFQKKHTLKCKRK